MRLYELDITLSSGMLLCLGQPNLFLRIQLNDGMTQIRTMSQVQTVWRTETPHPTWCEQLRVVEPSQVRDWCTSIERLGLLERALEVEAIQDTSDVWLGYQLIVKDVLRDRSRVHLISAYSSGLDGQDAMGFMELLRAMTGPQIVRLPQFQNYFR